jgi:hypothetical protein
MPRVIKPFFPPSSASSASPLSAGGSGPAGAPTTQVPGIGAVGPTAGTRGGPAHLGPTAAFHPHHSYHHTHHHGGTPLSIGLALAAAASSPSPASTPPSSSSSSSSSATTIHLGGVPSSPAVSSVAHAAGWGMAVPPTLGSMAPAGAPSFPTRGGGGGGGPLSTPSTTTPAAAKSPAAVLSRAASRPNVLAAGAGAPPHPPAQHVQQHGASSHGPWPPLSLNLSAHPTTGGLSAAPKAPFHAQANPPPPQVAGGPPLSGIPGTGAPAVPPAGPAIGTTATQARKRKLPDPQLPPSPP